MESLHTRTEMLIGSQGLERLRRSHVLVVGLGGVGGYAAEMLCRGGVGELTLVDSDTVSLTNLNRQIIALQSNVGKLKTDLFAERFRDINPDCIVHPVSQFLRDEAMVELLESTHFDYVVDAIDTLSPKVFLLYHARRLSLPVVSSMGSAGKTDATAVLEADISKSHTCPLAAMVRKRLHRLGVNDGIKVVFSSEKPAYKSPEGESSICEEVSQNKRTTIGTVSYIPPLFGCHVASIVLQDLTAEKINDNDKI